jgi:hypothetical protein
MSRSAEIDRSTVFNNFSDASERLFPGKYWKMSGRLRISRFFRDTPAARRETWPLLLTEVEDR